MVTRAAAPTPELPAAVVGGWTLASRAGEGASGVVFRASRADGACAALKVARTAEAWTAREAALLARAQRRWGPALLDAGRLTTGVTAPHGIVLRSGASWIATTWIDGESLADDRLKRRASPEARRALAAVVAHGVGRGLDELHHAGLRHGDVKPGNVLLGASHPTVDRAADRGATLVDLDLATEIADGTLEGGTPRYLSPELRAGEPATPAADLYALGLVLAEILAPGLADAPDLEPARVARALAAVTGEDREIAAWIEALVARAPGGRASADWIASRAARWLELAPDVEETIADRHARVRRTYIAVRSSRLEHGARPSAAIEAPARTWLDEALALTRGTEPASERELPPLDALGTGRWLVSLVGPAAASWPVPDIGEGALASRLLALAELAPPEAWTAADLSTPDLSSAPRDVPSRVERRARSLVPHEYTGAPSDEATLWVDLTRALSAARPDAECLNRAEQEVSRGRAPAGLAVDLARALLRRGDVGRAFAALVHAPADDDEATLLRADVARRRSDLATAEDAGRRAASSAEPLVRDGARALLARLAWDAGDLARAESELGGASGPAAAEVRALIAYARGEHERGLAVVEGASRTTDGGLGLARLEGTRGMLEHARGRARESVEAFGRAVELAMRAGAVVEEATYLTGLAAAAVDAGRAASALAAATRGALLWERLGRASLAARAHLSRAAAFALVGASHEADLAADEARRHALASNDGRAAAFARWAIVETRLPGDARAREEALSASAELATSGDEDRVRAAVRVLVWARDASLPLAIAAADERVQSLSAAARWEWWGARAAASSPSQRVLAELLALLDVPAPVGSRGPALAAGARLARALGDGEAARRIEAARRALATVLREGAPVQHRAALAAVGWLDGVAEEDSRSSLGAAQVGELEAIVRALSSRDRLKSLLEQVVDTMVLWTGVERGLLLLRAPDGKLVPRAARNLARQDLHGEQLELSAGLARRAMSEREAICATDAFAQVGDLHASVHALGLRSVLAVPLIARGDVLGVVYLDDRVRRGAFGPGELAWVRLVASQAALAIADARDQALLRRAVRKAERANARLAADLGAREAELERRSSRTFARSWRAPEARRASVTTRSQGGASRCARC